jgi:hypothetical protein
MGLNNQLKAKKILMSENKDSKPNNNPSKPASDEFFNDPFWKSKLNMKVNDNIMIVSGNSNIKLSEGK